MLIHALSLLSLLGCAHDKLAERGDNRELADLSTRAEDFWRAVQWQDAAGASSYIEDPTVRRKWSIEAERMVAETRVTEASLADVELGDLLDPPVDGRVRLGTVTMRTQGYTLPAQILTTSTVVQTWYRSTGGWFLDWDHGNPLTGLDW
ncbi:MAG: hypothetical protein GXP62_01570 [Oligoflexia bacterium]|nr:hypothetical protein [Oligoflexia bacterium]